MNSRLIHYFPTKLSGQSQASQYWVGWHRDVSFVTGLASAMYLNDQGEEV